MTYDSYEARKIKFSRVWLEIGVQIYMLIIYTRQLENLALI